MYIRAASAYKFSEDAPSCHDKKMLNFKTSPAHCTFIWPKVGPVDANLVNTQVLEHANRSDHFTSEELRRPVRLVALTGQIGRAQRASRRPKPASSGGMLSELADLGFLGVSRPPN